MQTKRLIGIAFAVVIACGLATSRAHATTYTVVFGGNYVNGDQVDIAFPGGTADTYAGDYNMTVAVNPSGTPVETYAYCTDLWDNVSNGTTWTANEVTPSSLYTNSSSLTLGDEGTRPSWMANLGSGVINDIAWIASNEDAESTPPSADAQLAIWELEATDSTADTFGSNMVAGAGSNFFNITSGNSDYAGINAILGAANAGTAGAYVPTATWLTVGTPVTEAQSFVFGTNNGTDGPGGSPLAPEPAQSVAFIVVGLGLAALMLRSRKAQQTLA